MASGLEWAGLGAFGRPRGREGCGGRIGSLVIRCWRCTYLVGANGGTGEALLGFLVAKASGDWSMEFFFFFFCTKGTGGWDLYRKFYPLRCANGTPFC